MIKFEIGRTLGRGQWGVVRKARRKCDGLETAIKKVRCGGNTEGINFQVLREIKMLRSLRHAHIVELHDVRRLWDKAAAWITTNVAQVFQNVQGDLMLSLVFELIASDLEKVLYDNSVIVSASQIRVYAFMLLDALASLPSHVSRAVN